MPLISGFKSTNVWKAFILSSITSSLVIIIALTVKSNFDTFSSIKININKYANKDGNKDTNKDTNKNSVRQDTNFKSILFTIIATFISSMIAYSSMYFIFGYGGGMLVNN